MAEIKLDTLSSTIRKELDKIRPELRSFAQKFSVVNEQRKDLAPRFMRVYNQIAGENDGFTFVEYVRLFDATVPTAASGDQGYRVHKTYMAADYLRRLTRQRPRGRQGVRDNATDALARSLATILQIVKADKREDVWSAVAREFGLAQRALTGLKRRVDSTQPLFKLPGVKPVASLPLVHMKRQEAEQEEEAA